MKKLLVTVTTLICLSLLGFSAQLYADDKPSMEKVAAVKAININTASAKELTKLPGIGAKKAEAIVAYREQIGGFKHLDDLIEVKGIGKKVLAKMQEHITL